MFAGQRELAVNVRMRAAETLPMRERREEKSEEIVTDGVFVMRRHGDAGEIHGMYVYEIPIEGSAAAGGGLQMRMELLGAVGTKATSSLCYGSVTCAVVAVEQECGDAVQVGPTEWCEAVFGAAEGRARDYLRPMAPAWVPGEGLDVALVRGMHMSPGQGLTRVTCGKTVDAGFVAAEVEELRWFACVVYCAEGAEDALLHVTVHGAWR
jgi:hypothetical protein